MENKSPFWRAWIIVALSLSLAACGQQGSDEIRIGLIAPRSGDLAVTGEAMVNAAQLAVGEINQAGGLDVGGRQVKIALAIEDDQGYPEKSVIAAQKLINQANVAAIVGPPFDRNAIPVSVVVESARIPMITPLSTDPQTTAGKRYVFRATFTNAFQGQVMARFAIESLGAAKDARGAAVLYDVANVYNRGIAETFKLELEKAGGRVALFESYTTGEQDFSRQLADIARVGSGINVLVLPNFPQDVSIQVQKAREAGIFQTIIGGDVLSEMNPAEHPELDRMFLTGHWHPDVDNEQSAAFVAAYSQAYGLKPGSGAALTYDAFGLLFKAIQSQALAEPEAIRDGLTSMGEYAGVTGNIEYQGSGDPVKSVAILQIKGDEFVFFRMVEPE